MFALLEGRTDEARRLNEEVAAIGVRARDENAALHARIQLWHTDVEEGRFDDSWLEFVEAAIARPTVSGPYICGLAWGYAETGRLDEARATLDRLGPDGLAAVAFDLNWFAAAAEFTRAAALLGDAERARNAYPLLRPYADRTVVVARAAACMGPVESYLGRLAATASEWEAAAAHFEAGLAACERMRAGLMLARTRQWYDEMLAARG
jgi:hypothetical protein